MGTVFSEQLWASRHYFNRSNSRVQFVCIAYRYFSGSSPVLRYKSVRTDATSIKKAEVEWSENIIILININEQLLSCLYLKSHILVP